MFRKKLRQEIHCHNCDQYVQFVMDMTKNGNHILTCPVCQHEHCRVVENGKITDIRWDQRNGPNVPVMYVTTSTTSVYSTSDSTSFIINAVYHTTWTT